MIPTAFDYVAPTSVDEAIAALAEAGDDAKVLVVDDERAILRALTAALEARGHQVEVLDVLRCYMEVVLNYAYDYGSDMMLTM